MCRFERRQEAFLTGQPLECDERVLVSNPRVLSAAGVVKPGVLGSDGRVVEPSGDRMGQLDVAVFVLQYVTACALEHARTAAGESGRVLARLDAVAAGLDANQPHKRIRD